jgi:hypothetical protein
MRMAEWLTYTDIEQLKQINRHYGCVCDSHSKYDLIRSLLGQIGRKTHLQKIVEALSFVEKRFLQLIVFDTSPSYTMEELLAKGRAALHGAEGEPRTLVVEVLKKGWLFPGYSPRNHYLYHIPSDTRQQILEWFISPFQQAENQLKGVPAIYRNEEQQMGIDLCHFLTFLQRQVVQLTQDGAIYKQQQKQLFKQMCMVEEPLHQKGPRFGFGRRYHSYPDRFSLLYDYAFYKGYFIEQAEGILCLTEDGSGKMNRRDGQEGNEMYRFWIRLYRQPIPHLPLVIRWIGLLSFPDWILLERVYQAVEDWLSPFFYETKQSLFARIIQMMVHLGALAFGTDKGLHYISLTPSGVKWMHGVSAFQERVIEEGFIHFGK